ncbi:HAMP domain-containing histidine kinase [Alkaliphilus pronyensis]|uniref:histidine kinase n=1 Tax=Alkaliphilus pronyensis TaxID=1482732 RepID=A0A6I0F830_9FIRM|nr:HAMP domain-containing sensor histidine kinase [Alkaliphilus pronyensis]KAB3534029.1 HAMP domain-containing histidine kinase [Alkaliphilus pronyensis]
MKYQELSKVELIQLLQSRDNTIEELNLINKSRAIKEKNLVEELKELEYRLRLKSDILEKQLKEEGKYVQLQSDFISNISHEFKTPLNIIFSTLQLLQFKLENNNSDINSIKLVNYIETMKQNSYRLLRLINNLIDIAKLDSGLLEPQLKELDVIKHLNGIISSLNTYLRNKKRLLHFNHDVKEKKIVCDPYMMERILLNLLSNAVKFTKPGDSIWVNVSDKGDYVLISVKDTGIGIPCHKKSLIFNRFRQINSTLNRSHEGCGIGLALVKSLVEIHGGKIFVESEIGVGSRFIVKLPTNIHNEKEICYCDKYVEELDVEKLQFDFCDIYE